MQTSRFQLGLIATLAVGLGFSLSSSEAVGYPAGPAISMGSNPVVSTGGSFVMDSSTTALTAPVDKDIVITDVHVSTDTDDFDCLDRIPVLLRVDGVDKGQLSVSTPYHHVYQQVDLSGVSETLSLNSGIRIPAGSDLVLSSGIVRTTTYAGCWSGRTVNVRYTLSGYYAQP
jgi:hypothetical protein